MDYFEHPIRYNSSLLPRTSGTSVKGCQTC
jgi:hypothetical protein